MILQQPKTYGWYDDFTVLKTYAWFPRTSLELLSRKGLEAMFCLIWYGLVTDFTSRSFKNLLTLPVLSNLWPALQAGNKIREIAYFLSRVILKNHEARPR